MLPNQRILEDAQHSTLELDPDDRVAPLALVLEPPGNPFEVRGRVERNRERFSLGLVVRACVREERFDEERRVNLRGKGPKEEQERPQERARHEVAIPAWAGGRLGEHAYSAEVIQSEQENKPFPLDEPHDARRDSVRNLVVSKHAVPEDIKPEVPAPLADQTQVGPVETRIHDSPN